MSKAQNIHDTKRWKRKRKGHNGDLCDNADCGICAVPLKSDWKLACKDGPVFDWQELD